MSSGPASFREGAHVLDIKVVADTLDVFQSAVLFPDLAGFLRDISVGIDFVLRQWKDESVDVFTHDFRLGLLVQESCAFADHSRR